MLSHSEFQWTRWRARFRKRGLILISKFETTGSPSSYPEGIDQPLPSRPSTMNARSVGNYFTWIWSPVRQFSSANFADTDQ